MSLYRGALLPDCQEEWVLPERKTYEQAYLNALETLAAHATADGQSTDAVHWLRLLLATDPYRESACCALMQALSVAGDHAAVTQVYRDLRLVLRRDLNTDPAPKTQALYRNLLAHETRSAILPSASPAPAGPPRRLPVPLTDLIGREEEIEEVGGWLGTNRLVTLVGTGGVGKTRLSLAVAERVIAQFPDGVWFVDLAPLSDSALLAQTLLRTLDLHEESSRTPEETLEQALSSRIMLLVMDNCEHLVEACTSLTHRLLSTCSDLRVLATSREALGLTDEYLYRVPSLALPPQGQPNVEKATSSLLEYEAVRLFVERARQANTSFQLNRSNAGAVVQICQRLDGIPLAIEMATARVKSLSVAHIAARLEDRFHLLTGGSRAALPRQRTLQATIDWSYDLLSEAERALFRRLCVFAGGWSLEAAEAVCAGAGVEAGEVLNVLIHLVEKSLVIFEEPVEGRARYHMLESLRQYGVERLAEAGETEALNHRHRDFFLQWVEEVEPHFYGPEQSTWYATVEKEYANLRVALESYQKEEAADRALRLTGALSAFWDVRGYFKEGLSHQITALSLAGAVGTKARARVLLAAGQLSVRQSDHALARTLIEECLMIRRELGDKHGVVGALNECASVALHLGHHGLVRSHCEESLLISQELGDKRGTIGAFNILGQLSIHEGDHALARSCFEKCLAIQRELRDPRGIAGSLGGLATAAYALGDYAQARAFCEESLEISQQLGDKLAIEHTFFTLGNVACADGDYGRASTWYKECLALRWELRNLFHIVQSLADFANLAGRQGQHERAARLLGAAKALCQTLGISPPVADSEEYARTIDTAGVALDKEAITAAWEKGRAMSLEQMVEYALS